MAMAATTTIVEVENDVLEPGELDPDHVHVPGIYVDRIVKIPEDGIWSGAKPGL
jgi:acyl CoA:acetate/3-ketoacid CoA transferase alpha subunit